MANYNKVQREAFNKLRRNDNVKLTNVKTDGWMNILTGLGVRGRDKNVATVFRMCYKFSVAQLDDIYRSDGMTRRVIDLVAEEMVRQGWEIEGEFNKEVQNKLEEMKVFSVMMDMIRWSRLYGGSLGVIGIVDGRNLDKPVDYNNIQSINWVHVFDRFSVSSADGTIEIDLDSPNYGKPIHYLVTDSRSGNTFTVHWTRTIRCDWNELTPRWVRDNDTWGDPLMQTIYEELKNYSTAFANCGVIMQDFVNYVMKIPGLAQLLASGCDNEVMNRINILNIAKSSLNTMVIDEEETYEKVSTNISGIPELLDRFMLSLSAVTGIPITLLFGRAPSGLNATGDADIRNFYDMIKQKQEGKLRPMLEYLIRLIYLQNKPPFIGKEPKNWKLTFDPLWQNTDQEESEIRRTVAETDAVYIDRGVLDPTEVAISRFGGTRYSMNTEIDIEARENGFDTFEVAELEEEKQESQIKELE